jgi:hypothetical protein
MNNAIQVLRLEDTDKLTLANDSTPTALAAKDRAWTARVYSSVACHVAIRFDTGTNPATVDDMLIAANRPILLAVGPDESVMALGTAAGSLWVTEVRVSS